ncbi:hypothetical protein BCR33DRAFT_720393 [Rhizoclosmatium globosum]|uniref:G-protein coupled receptors family 2 profile 2 domain-containing protein n=1 Tax=Rhizoclosmatium globosum TaxID=329046 RepID=A0A1Y2BWL5_9FUNG|nr:hypothetical protein BCR33DRAFT_720393 [Rhizoclosmatium globosum]|eukprot:ORY39160.1 hypothetical protein BCR33DRAFT_720393 [Rhizoclosmatium globosum]
MPTADQVQNEWIRLIMFMCWIAFTQIPTTITWGVGRAILSQHALCTFFGINHQFFLISTASWQFNASIVCWIAVIYGNQSVTRYWPYFHTYAWGSGIVFTTSLFIGSAILKRGEVMGDGTYACWISPLYLDFRIWSFFDWIWLQFILIMGSYSSMAFMASRAERSLAHVRRSSITADERNMEKEQKTFGPRSGSSDSQSKSNSDHDRSKRISLSSKSGRGEGLLAIAVNESLRHDVKIVMITEHNSNLSRIAVRGVIIGTVLGFMGIKTPDWLAIATSISLGTSGLWNPVVYFVFRRK